MLLRAFGEGESSGDKLVRFVYLDESGIGDQRREPFVIVAGVIVHADTQLLKIENRLRAIKEQFFPPALQFYPFHAKELFSGGRILRRDTYSRESRWSALEQLCRIPQEFDLPIVVGFVDRESYKAEAFRQSWDKSRLMVGAYSVSFMVCLIAAEKYLRKHSPDEVATLICENNEDARRSLHDAQKLLRMGEFTRHLPDTFLGTKLQSYLPLTKITEGPFFAEKGDSSVLQIADVVAWAVNRKLRSDPECDRFFSPIDRQIGTIRPKAFGVFPGFQPDP